MLICNTSAHPLGHLITSDLAEEALALDTPITGILFTTLVDDPAFVQEMLDAYLGSIMSEAVSAGDSFDATAVGGGTVYATFDGVNTNVSISGGGLIVTHSGGGTYNGARSTMQKNSGKWYFEITKHLQVTPYDVIGILTVAGTYTNMVNDWTNSLSDRAFYNPNYDALIGPSGSSPGINLGGTTAPSDPVTIGIAVDLDNDQIWFRYCPSGNWNNSGTANPATNTGGVNISALNTTTVSPAIGFNGSASSGEIFTGNFGASTFSSAVPSGFNAGWF